MANQIQAQHLFRYRNFHINKSQPLGHGSYGAVYKAKCDQLPCAAKVLHPTILDPRDPGAGKIMQRFQQEIAFLERIRHSNVIIHWDLPNNNVLIIAKSKQSLCTSTLTHSIQYWNTRTYWPTCTSRCKVLVSFRYTTWHTQLHVILTTELTACMHTNIIQ